MLRAGKISSHAVSFPLLLQAFKEFRAAMIVLGFGVFQRGVESFLERFARLEPIFDLFSKGVLHGSLSARACAASSEYFKFG